ncbi:hypothetical protein C9J98_05815 [Stenotrophomonas panacihumi]|nr:hypothetical protein C9J98_05815 [Stenotrophomonas panacihumi]
MRPVPLRTRNLLLVTLFGLYILLGLCIYPDYGVSWDEPISRTNGMVNLKYLEKTYFPAMLTPDVARYPDLQDWVDRDYGVAFELPLAALEQAFGVTGAAVYPFRHLLTFLFSTLGVLALYKTAAFVYRDYRAGLLAALMLVLSPRLFGESFYNSKDVVFLTVIALSTYTMTRLLWTPGWRWAVLHGLACGFAIDVRVMGVVMIPLTLAFLLVRLLKREISVRDLVIAGVTFAVTTVVVVVALFPFLWEDPLGNFLLTFGNMSKFRWSNQVLYLGELLRSTDLPWHYIPVWLLLTTPPLFTALMLAGAVHIGRNLLANRVALWATPAQMSELSFLALFLGPIVAVIAVGSVLYDGWRHLYFVYPAFLLVATGGAVAIARHVRHVRTLRIAFLGCIALALSCNVAWMARAHPLQNVYFNVLAGSNWKQHFDLDYWGLSNRDALRAILEADKSPLITIRVVGMTSLEPSTRAFAPSEAERLLLVDWVERPRYLLTNYRGEPKGIDPRRFPGYAPFYERKVGEEVVVTVLKRVDTSTEDAISRATRAYTEEEFKGLSYSLAPARKVAGATYVDLKIVNSGDQKIAALTSGNNPIHVSWRFLDRNDLPAGGFEPRLKLPRDIPAHGEAVLPIRIDRRKIVPGGTLQVDLVQEGTFWGQAIGMPPATLPWPAPGISVTSRAYTEAELSGLGFQLAPPRRSGGHLYVDLRIANNSGQRLAAMTTNNTPLRVSWRFLDRDGQAVGGFDPRINLPADIPAHGVLTVPLRIDPRAVVPGGTLEADLVQEGMFWGRSIGLTTATLRWPDDLARPAE